MDYWAEKDYEALGEKYGLVYLTGHGESDTKFLKALISQRGLNLSKISQLALDGSMEVKNLSVTTEMSKRMNLMLKVEASEIFGIVLVNP